MAAAPQLSLDSQVILTEGVICAKRGGDSAASDPSQVWVPFSRLPGGEGKTVTPTRGRDSDELGCSVNVIFP